MVGPNLFFLLSYKRAHEHINLQEDIKEWKERVCLLKIDRFLRNRRSINLQEMAVLSL